MQVVSFATAARSILEASAKVLTPIFTCCYSKTTSRCGWSLLISGTGTTICVLSLQTLETTVYAGVIVNSEKGNRLECVRWHPGCNFRFYCCSTVWPASQYNSQTIPCCYSITRSAVLVAPLPNPYLCDCTLFSVLQALSLYHMFRDW